MMFFSPFTEYMQKGECYVLYSICRELKRKKCYCEAAPIVYFCHIISMPAQQMAGHCQCR